MYSVLVNCVLYDNDSRGHWLGMTVT